MKKIFFFILLLMLGIANQSSLNAQDSTSQAKLQFSLLTCDAGDDLYTLWGHTAIRVVDSVNHTDIVYNFGSFDFNTPQFTAKFMRGDLLYFISANTYSDFLYEYQYFKRDVHEQVLKITDSEKIKWYTELQTNMIGNNRFYLYNFIYDNCTTRIKEGVFKHAPVNNYSIGIHSYREEIVSACYKGGMGWVGLGIDLLLGSVADQSPNLQQEAFLPKLLMQKMALNTKLVLATHYIKNKTEESAKGVLPINILLVLLLLYAGVSFSKNKTALFIGKSIDLILLFILGLGGLLVAYMSWFSMHDACHQNFNILWLHPFYLIALLSYFISKKWTSYLGFLFFATMLIVTIGNFWIPQHFSKAVIVLMAITMVLNARLILKNKHEHK